MWIVLGAAGLFGALAGDLAARVGPARGWVAAAVTVALAALARPPAAARSATRHAGSG